MASVRSFMCTRDEVKEYDGRNVDVDIRYLPIGSIISFWRPERVDGWGGETRRAVVLEHHNWHHPEVTAVPNERILGDHVRILMLDSNEGDELWFDPRATYFEVVRLSRDHTARVPDTLAGAHFAPWMVPRKPEDAPRDLAEHLRIGQELDVPLIGTGYGCKRRCTIVDICNMPRDLIQVRFHDILDQAWMDPTQVLFFKVEEEVEVEEVEEVVEVEEVDEPLPVAVQHGYCLRPRC